MSAPSSFPGYGPPQRHGWVRELAPWLVLLALGWFAFGRVDAWLASSAPTSSYPAAPSTSGPTTTNPEQIVVQVLMPTATPEPTPTATPLPVVTATPTRGYPYCDPGMSAGDLCYQTVPVQPTPTIPVCDWTRNGLCRMPSAPEVAARQEVE